MTTYMYMYCKNKALFSSNGDAWQNKTKSYILVCVVANTLFCSIDTK